MAIDCNFCSYWKYSVDSWTYPLKIFESVLALVLSATEIIILRRKRAKVIHERILLSLSICDSIVSLAAVTSLVLVKIAYLKELTLLAHWLMVAWLCLVNFAAPASLLHLIYLTLDRAWAIAAPFNHRVYATNKIVTVSLVLSWIIPILPFPIYFGIIALREKWTGYEAFQILKGPTSTFLTVLIVIAYMTFAVSYLFIARTLFRTIPQSQIEKNSQNPTQREIYRSRRKTLYLCVAIVVSFVISTFPLVIVSFYRSRVPNYLLMEVAVIFFPLNGSTV